MRTRTLIKSGLFVAGLSAVGVSLLAHHAAASSHREAPFITKNPKVDSTDFYMFKSYEANRADYVTLIANYMPLQNQYGGPNFFTMDPQALYEIHIDNDGDAKENITFQFKFSTVLLGTTLPVGSGGANDPVKNVAIPLINSGVIGAAAVATPAAAPPANANVTETYTVTMVKGDRRTGAATPVYLATDATKTVFQKPLDYIGQKSLGAPAAYEAYARKYIYDVKLDGCATPARVFVGQRKETFAVNLGVIFDLVNAPFGTIAQPLSDALGAKSNRAATANPIANTNITSIAMEVPTACLTGSAVAAAGNPAGAAGLVIGGWQSASVRQARVINPTPSFAKPTVEGGAWAQVSRLGFPLVNEAVIGLPDKDKFNSSLPKDDLTNFANYVTNPTLPALLQILFSGANYVAPPTPRNDIVAVAITGVPNVNAPVGGGAGEMQRLNVGFPIKTLPNQFPLGAAGCFLGTVTAANPFGLDASAAQTNCDPNGFPNGRRPLDDVTDIILSVVGADFLRFVPTALKPERTVLHDTVAEEAGFLTPQKTDAFPNAEMFPYLPTPNGGT